MNAIHDDLSGFGSLHSPQDNPFTHSPLVILDDSGGLSPAGAAGGGNGGGGGGASGKAPDPTLVTAPGSNLAIDLIWDSSVAAAPAGFTSALIASAAALVTDLTTPRPDLVKITVGWGEISGQGLLPGALGESGSYGYLTDYATVAGALAANGYAPAASNGPTTGGFFVPVAEAKALGLITGMGPNAPPVDGFVGFANLSGTGYSWQVGSTGTTATQFNLQSIALHELTEVMGRTEMEGLVTFNGLKTYTPLDLFDFSAQNTLSLSNNGGYFSTDNGATALGNFSNSRLYGGDIADWSSYHSAAQSGTLPGTLQDAFNSFTRPGYDVTLSADDLLLMKALGYDLTAAGQVLV